jgi:hypothetical protein
MNVSLTPELEPLVDAKVESGLYNNSKRGRGRKGLRILKGTARSAPALA